MAESGVGRSRFYGGKGGGVKIAVVGTGYVGLTTGACFADLGHQVICADVLADRIAGLARGEMPFFEPGLGSIVRHSTAEGRLSFTTDVTQAVHRSYLIFIAVGTPSSEDGSADLRHILEAAAQVARAIDGERIVVLKSTVPVGTHALVRRAIEAETRHAVNVCSNPEFLREGTAVQDFTKPDRVVLGVDDPEVAELMKNLYAPFVRTGAKIVVMDTTSAEITKYAANAMLATRLSFVNLIANLCEKVGADVDLVRQGIGTDSRIGANFLFPGVGYGGSCFPKDVKALVRTLREVDLDPAIPSAVDEFNDRQQALLLRMAEQRFGDDLSGKVFGVWGLAFKANTDDVREASSLVTIKGLLARGAKVSVHDPAATDSARRILGSAVEYAQRDYDVLSGADALCIHTEWRQYRCPDFGRMGSLMRQRVVFDGRNLYDPGKMRKRGFEYYSVGRRPVVPEQVGGRARCAC